MVYCHYNLTNLKCQYDFQNFLGLLEIHNLNNLNLYKKEVNVMFKENFIRLCNQKGESPSSVCRKVGIAPATFSCWTSESVPRKATLLRIADYFGVSVSYLLGVVDDPDPMALIDPSKKEPPFLPSAEEAGQQLEALAALGGLVDQLTEGQVEELRKYAEYLISKK